DVDVDDVAVLEHLRLARDPVADHVVGRDAGGARIALVAQVGGHGLLHVDDVVVADAVEFQGGDAGLDVLGHDLEHLGGQAAGDAHLLDLLGGLELDGHAGIIAEPGRPCRRAPGRASGPRPPAAAPGALRPLVCPGPAPRAIISRLCFRDPGGRLPTPGIASMDAGEYTPAAIPRAGVPRERFGHGGSGEAQPRNHAPVLRAPPPIRSTRRPVPSNWSSTHAPDHHAPDAGSRRAFRPPDALLE